MSAVAALYLNVFVLISQSVLTAPGLRALATTQTEPALAVPQRLDLAFFL